MDSAEHIPCLSPTFCVGLVSKNQTQRMKLFSALLIISLFALSCESDDATLVGKWSLQDYYLSSGSNDVSYKKATTEWTLEFFEDGTVHSSSTLCKETAMFEGTYDGQDVAGNGCAAVYAYSLNGKYLIISGKTCIEGCSSRFVKKFSFTGQ